jgi:hypothetical protein
MIWWTIPTGITIITIVIVSVMTYLSYKDANKMLPGELFVINWVVLSSATIIVLVSWLVWALIF